MKRNHDPSDRLPSLRVLPFDEARANHHFMPQAIVSEPVMTFADRENTPVVVGVDALDRFGAVAFSLHGRPFTIMQYDGFPEGTSTIYLPKDISSVPAITEAIGNIIGYFGLPASKLVWQRRDDHRSEPMPVANSAGKGLGDLFLDTLKDIYFAEKMILKALPKMAKAVTSDDLRAAFQTHRAETERQIERLEQIFAILQTSARGKHCDAINGILEEGSDIMAEYKGTAALDAGLLAAAQAIEHYEISRYGTLKAWAGQLGRHDVARLLDETLVEEKRTDEVLSRLAVAAVSVANDTAA